MQSNFCHTHPPTPGYRDPHLLWPTFRTVNMVARALGSGRLAITSHSPMWPPGVDSSVLSVSSTPMLNSAACAAACSRSSAISSTLPSTGFSCLRWFLRSALSLCLCCRVCSFWRFVNVDRPLGIHIPRHILCSSPTASCNVAGPIVFEKATSAVRAAAVDDHGSHRARGRVHRQNDGLHLVDARTWVWPR